jgi:hypothetical protein
MQYSVRTRRRLRQHTSEHAPVATAGIVQAQIADGSGAVKRPLITQPVIERISPRALINNSSR